MLPQEFLNEIRKILPPEEIDQFLASYQQPKTSGLRVNTLKTTPAKLRQLLAFELSPIPWCPEGFYYDGEHIHLGNHPLHHAGAFYIQEPSAMAVVPKLAIQPGDFVLDLCAAPGGKATQIGQALKGRGVLVANEISPSRIKPLGENLERLGIGNAILTNSSVKNLQKDLPNFFDKILIDAPCCGQGMFRKEPRMLADWSLQKTKDCANIQYQLIRDAYYCLKPGGRLVYSTCTFAREENEEIIQGFIDDYPDMQLVEMNRLWPHKLQGEGHFYAVLVKRDRELPKSKVSKAASDGQRLEPFFTFAKEYLRDIDAWREMQDRLLIRGEQIYLVPKGFPRLSNNKVVRPGLCLGNLKPKRFEPAHALAHYLTPEGVNNHIELAEKPGQVASYLRGETLNTGGNRGWVLVSLYGLPLGWGKEVGKVLKNHYPKGLRLLK